MCRPVSSQHEMKHRGGSCLLSTQSPYLGRKVKVFVWIWANTEYIYFLSTGVGEEDIWS